MSRPHTPEVYFQNNATQPAIHPEPMRPSAFKIPNPETYEGKRDAKAIQSYLISIEGYLFFYPGLPEEHKIRIAVMYLRKDALIWATKTQGFTSFEEFKQRLTGQFLPKDHQRLARSRLKNIKQKQSASNYISDFLDLSSQIHPPFQESHLIDLFIDGLKPNVQKEVVIKYPTSLEEAFEIAIRVDDIEFRHKKKFQSNTSSTTSTQGFQQTRNTPRDDPMQLDNIHGRLQKLTLEEKEKLAKEGKCFRCRQKGHMSRDCSGKSRSINHIGTQSASTQAFLKQ